MTILVAVKKNGRVFLGADRMMSSGAEYTTDIVNGTKLIKLKHAYLATSGYTLLDNVIEHLYHKRHAMMENTFKDRAEVFQFFLDFFAELKKNYTLVDTGKETYAGLYNVFLLVTPQSIFGISANLSVHEFERFAAKGAGADYSLGCLFGIYDLIENGHELTRLGLEAACHYSIYCKEPLDIVEVKASDFGKMPGDSHKVKGKALVTHIMRKGVPNLIAVPKTGTNLARARATKATAPRAKKETGMKKPARPTATKAVKSAKKPAKKGGRG